MNKEAAISAREAAKWMHLSIFGNLGPTDDKWDRLIRAALDVYEEER